MGTQNEQGYSFYILIAFYFDVLMHLMRTTVTLDSDVERILRDEIHRSRRSFKEVLNDAVRRALKPKSPHLPNLLPPVPMGVMPGVDPARLPDLADDLEVDAYRALSSRQRVSEG